MQVGALRPYERSLTEGEPLRLWHEDGRLVTLDIERWLAPADHVDADVLTRARAPVLDVGCGPGRILAHLTDRGMLSMGIDIAVAAVSLSRSRGLNALRRSVFARLPGEGRWASVLLLDGNIGIGGDPAALLARARQLLAPTGRVIVETHTDHDVHEQCTVRFTHTGEPIGPSFPWAHVGPTHCARYGRLAGFAVTETWTAHGRTFVMLEPTSRDDLDT